jgi:CHAD domain-containing protein
LILKAKDKLIAYIKKRASAIDSFLEKPPQEFSAEDFHDLRVEIKKLKAGFALVAFCSRKISLKEYYKPFKSIFRQAGKIREMQIQQSIQKRYKLYQSLKNFDDYFKKDYETEFGNFLLLINDELKDKIRKREESILSLYADVQEACIDEMAAGQKKKIKGLLGEENLSAEQIHNLRKWLKEHIYICKLFSLKENPIKRMDALQHLLGIWHDYHAIGMNLENAIKSGNMMEEEINNIQILQKKIATKCEVLLRKAISDFNELFSPL